MSERPDEKMTWPQAIAASVMATLAFVLFGLPAIVGIAEWSGGFWSRVFRIQ